MPSATMTLPARPLASVLCVMALAGILISPAVPSPPTVMGGFHPSLGGIMVAMLPALCGILLMERGSFGRSPESTLVTPLGGSGPSFLPLRR